MLTGELRNKVDRVWDAFWTGGISNPLTVIEQITYLLFIKRLDELHTLRENKANTLNEPIENPVFGSDQQDLRWSRFKDYDPQRMYELMTRPDGIFDFMKSFAGHNGSTYAKYMKGATFMIPTPNLLEKVVTMLSDIPMHDRDTKGDLYEYLLSKIASAGKNGQFRTPRHIIRMMVEMVKPTPGDVICDPAAGTCGFLVAAGEYLYENYPEIFRDSKKKEHYHKSMFYGNEFDATMIRIGAMNMLLHGIENPNLDDKDSLSESNQALREQFTVVLANPPFKGSLDYDSVEKSLLRLVKTKKTELLFLALMLRALKTGGRCAVIVPDGVLFGSSNAHKAIRKELIDRQKLQAVISMPSGVFKPYAGVSTAVLVFTKTESGGTDRVWFYDMQADGYSLDDRRNPVEQNDIPDVLDRWDHILKGTGAERQSGGGAESAFAEASADEKTGHSAFAEASAGDRTEQSFFVPVQEIRDNNYDLSINRYKEIVYEEVEYDPPKEIIAQIKQLESKKKDILKEIEEMLDN